MNTPLPSVHVYPRLQDSAGRALAMSRRGLGLDAIASSASFSHLEAAPNATGGKPVSPDILFDVQSTIRGLARDFGYPLTMSIRKQAEFDRICGTLLFQKMGIVPADAGHNEVWSFVTLVLMPEIAPWRFGDPPEFRLLGGTRNTFQRLWWRAWALGPDLTKVPPMCQPFGEDDYVQIMERPSLAGNARVAKAIQSTIWLREALGLESPRPALLRLLVKRVRAARSHISFDSLTDDQFSSLLARIRDEAIASLVHEPVSEARGIQ